jgi:voltage-gated potassium channel
VGDRVVTDRAVEPAEDRSSSANLARLAAYDEWMHLPIVLAAILPIVMGLSAASEDSGISIAVFVVSWLVFVVDLGVHMRLRPGYLKTGVGVFDLAIVLLTAPWFLVPGLGGSQILVTARLGRLGRLLLASPGARRALKRLGRVGIFAGAMLLLGSWLAYTAERATNPEFANYGDSLWWGIVTLTTVGYGDIVPETTKGRVAGVFLMITGIATLGILSGTLASFFRGASVAAQAPSPEPEPDTEVAPLGDDELDEVRRQLADIAERLANRR